MSTHVLTATVQSHSSEALTASLQAEPTGCCRMKSEQRQDLKHGCLRSLVADLSHESSSVRSRATKQLVLLSSGASPTLFRELKRSRSSKARQGIVDVFYQTGDVRALSRVLGQASELDPNIVLYAFDRLKALNWYPETELQIGLLRIDQLRDEIATELLRDPDKTVGCLVTSYCTSDRALGKAIVGVLRKIPPAYLERVRTDSAVASEAERYLALVVRTGSDFWAECIRLTEDPSPLIREAAVGWLCTSRDLRAIGPLVSCLDDEDLSVRQSAFETLKQYGEAATPTLRERVRSAELLGRELAMALIERRWAGSAEYWEEQSEDCNTEFGITDEDQAAILYFEDSLVPERLVESLVSTEQDVREDALQKLVALGQIAVPSLIHTLRTGSTHSRSAAADALGDIASRQALPFLSIESQSFDYEVRDAARFAIQKIKFADSLEPPRKGSRTSLELLQDILGGTNAPSRALPNCSRLQTLVNNLITILNQYQEPVHYSTIVGSYQERYGDIKARVVCEALRSRRQFFKEVYAESFALVQTKAATQNWLLDLLTDAASSTNKSDNTEATQ